MKVLFLVSRDRRHPSNTGGDIGLWERAMYLAEQGHRVTVMASSFPGALSQESIGGIEVVRRGGLLSLWWRTFLYYMTECRGLYDVVVVEGFGGSRIPRFTPLYVKEPIVTEWHQIHAALFVVQYHRLLVPALNLLERMTARVHRDTIIMARTADWKDAFPRIGFRPDRIRVVPACIPEEWLSHGVPTPRDPQFVWLGKFRRYKCPDHAIRAMQDVIRVVPKARLILAGYHDDLGYEAELQALVAGLGLRSVVEFRFGISEDEKKMLLDSSRALVLPSTVEGFGIVVLEANARSVPVIASSGVPEGAVQDNQNGLRYTFGDVGALAQRMAQLAMDDGLHAQLAIGSLRFAAQYTWRKVCRLYEDVLLEAVAERRATRLVAPE